MKRFDVLRVLVVLFLIVQKSDSKEIHFISQPQDSLWRQTYCWQPGNQYRPLILLDGEWEYRGSEKDSFKKVVLPATCHFEGEITFRKSFVPDPGLTNHFFRLICYGINYSGTIFINNKFIGSHAGGYNSFAIDIADGIILLNQKNTIEMKINTRLDSKNTIPQCFQPDGVQNVFGIYRSLYLLAIPELSIEDLTINPQLTPDFIRCELEIKFNLKDRINNFVNPGPTKAITSLLQYNIELYEKDQDRPIIFEKQEINATTYELARTIVIKIILNQPQLWSPDTPTLYTLCLQLSHDKQVIDQINHSFGIKQIDLHDGNIYLNGKQIVLKGINWCENYLIDGALLDRTQLVSELNHVKQLHANALRVLNHPAHPMVASVCDSLGLFLLQEIPLNQVPTPRFQSHQFLSHCTDYFSEMVQRDQAHACIFAWGLGSQFLLYDLKVENLLNKLVKSVSHFNHDPVYLWNSPPLPAALESNIITGISIFDLKKEKLQPALSRWTNKTDRGIKIVFSYGSALPEVSSDNDKKALFEEYQLSKIVETWRAITNLPDIDGYFLTALSDYRGHYPTTMYKNPGAGDLRPSGLIDNFGKKRLAYEVVRSLYQEGKYRYNSTVTLKDGSPAEFPIVGLATLLVFLFIINSRRYFRENLKRIFVHAHGFYVDIRDGRKIPPFHTIFLMLFIVIGWGLILASFLSFFKSQPQIDHLLTLLLPRENLKNYISHLSWQPGQSILFFSVVSFMLFFLIAIYFKLIAIITRKHCTIGQCLTIPFWTGVNFIIFIPLGIILIRLFQYEQLIIPLVLLLLISCLWFLSRVIKVMRVIFIWTFQRSFIVLIITLAILIAGMAYYYQYHYVLVDYVKFYYQVYGHQILALTGLEGI